MSWFVSAHHDKFVNVKSFAEASMEVRMQAMDTTFLTISEAAEKTGRSLSTIRRIIKSIADNDDHADRDAVQPTPKQVAAFKKKEENFAWKIREDVLTREIAGAPNTAKKHSSGLNGDILSILQRELDLKNQQIEKQWEVIHSLNDRLREGNILMGSLQKRLALPEPQEEREVVQTTTVSPSPEAAKKGSKPVHRSPQGVGGKPARKGMFSWLLR